MLPTEFKALITFREEPKNRRKEIRRFESETYQSYPHLKIWSSTADPRCGDWSALIASKLAASK
jgi:hypothetical protein